MAISGDDYKRHERRGKLGVHNGDQFDVLAGTQAVLLVAFMVLVKVFSSEKNQSISAHPCLSSLSHITDLSFLNSLETSVISMQ